MRILRLCLASRRSCCCSLPRLCSLRTPAQVTEPVIPAACVTLDADIAASHGVIAPADEQKLDTERIQHAIDTLRCTGKARRVAARPGPEECLPHRPAHPAPRRHAGRRRTYRSGGFARSAPLRSRARQLRHRRRARPRLQAADHRRWRKERRHHGRRLHRCAAAAPSCSARM